MSPDGGWKDVGCIEGVISRIEGQRKMVAEAGPMCGCRNTIQGRTDFNETVRNVGTVGHGEPDAEGGQLF